jgi:hypothetical protein
VARSLRSIRSALPSPQALGINDLGDIVGFYADASGFQHGYIDDEGVFTTFDPTGSTNTTINGINNLGDIVGFYTDANGDTVGFVGTPVPEPTAPIAVALAGLIAARLGRRSFRQLFTRSRA